MEETADEKRRRQRRESYHRNKGKSKSPAQVEARRISQQAANRKYNAKDSTKKLNAQRKKHYNESHKEMAAKARVKHRDGKVPGPLYKAALQPIIDDGAIESNYLGPMDKVCPHCGALFFAGEADDDGFYNKCCGKGNVKLPPVEKPPDFLAKLLTREDRSAAGRSFDEHTRLYNSLSSFAKVIMSNTVDMDPRRGVPVLKVGGEIRRVMHNNFNNQLNTYIGDTESGTKFIPDEALLKQIKECMNEVNPYAKDFATILADESKSFYTGTSDKSNVGASDIPAYQIVIEEDLRPINAHKRTYNKPSVREIAGFYPLIDEVGDGKLMARTLAVTKKSNFKSEQYISYRHSSYDPLAYTLYHMNGLSGWGPNLPLEHDPFKHMTLAQFYRYRAHVRDPPLGPLLQDTLFYGGSLYQQYWVDQYMKIEEDRLEFIRDHQKELKASTYHAVKKHLDEGSNLPEKHVILAPSFNGGPRDQQEKFQDAMAVAAKYGSPDLFITMTANTNWREIQENLKPGQDPFERPDIINRVFKLKLKALMDLIVKEEIFGEVAAHLHVIEFQKRGLPHAHILITLSKKDKPHTEADFGSFGSAEIPDPCELPRLHEIILSRNIHKPCQEHGPSHACTDDSGRCGSYFPKEFHSETVISDEHYCYFQRRSPDEGGLEGTINIKGTDYNIDNSWVVSYNAFLSLTFDCHLNMEMCNTFGAIRYLHKYFFKGPDMAMIGFKSNAPVDEIKQWIQARRIGPSEAMWRIMAFPLRELQPPVEVLPHGLPGEEILYYEGNDSETLEKRVREREGKDNKLQSYFIICSQERISPLTEMELLYQYKDGVVVPNPPATELTYFDFPQHYRWDDGLHLWVRRKKLSPSIGRPYATYAYQGEKHFLRLLLGVVKGAESYECLRTTPDGTIHATFQAAANARGLISGDEEWDDDLQQASRKESPKQLRDMFVYILVFNKPANSLELWHKYKDALSSDFTLTRSRISGKRWPFNASDDDYNCALIAINQDIKSRTNHSEDNATYGLPLPTSSPEIQFQASESEAELYLKWVNERVPLLQDNKEQYAAFNVIVDAVLNNKPKLFCIDGRGGTGKTFLLNCLISYIRHRGKHVIACASTGIASTLLLHGLTTHSCFNIPLCVHDRTFLSLRDYNLASVKKAHLIIIDEYSVHDRYIGAAIDRTLKSIMGNGLPFGGKTVVFSGDLRQTLTIVETSSSKPRILDRMFTAGSYWSHVHHLTLATNERIRHSQAPTDASESAAFADFLKNLGEGKLPIIDEKAGIELPESFIHKGEDLEGFIDECYPSLRAGSHDFEARTCILTPKNKDADEINNICLERLTGEELQFLSSDSVTDETSHMYPLAFLNKLQPSGFPPHELKLKVGCPIMLIRNLHTKKGYVNGTTLKVLSADRYYIKAKRPYDPDTKYILIPRMKLDLDSKKVPIKLMRVQFPVRLAFAMTINKSQGQTFSKVGLYLPSSVFAHGQLYVSCSRTGNPKSLSIFMRHQANRQGVFYKDGLRKYYTQNIVYKEALIGLI